MPVVGTCAMEPAVNLAALVPNDTWWPLLPSRQLKRKPIALERLGAQVVVWRNGRGEAQAHGRFCPHRRADLGQGSVHGHNLVCKFHGFEFDGTGQCRLMPCEGSAAKIPPGMAIRRFPCLEAHGFLWLWSGSPETMPAAVPYLPALAGIPPLASADTEMLWEMPLERSVEQLMDMHHTPFTHPLVWLSISSKRNTRMVYEDLQLEGDHWRGTARFEPDGGGGKSFRLPHQLLFPNQSLLEFDYGIYLYATLVPINRERSIGWVRYLVKAPFSRALSGISNWLEARFVQPDDLAVLLANRPARGGLQHQCLVKADSFIAHWHRRWSHLVPGAYDEANPKANTSS